MLIQLLWQTMVNFSPGVEVDAANLVIQTQLRCQRMRMDVPTNQNLSLLLHLSKWRSKKSPAVRRIQLQCLAMVTCTHGVLEPVVNLATLTRQASQRMKMDIRINQFHVVWLRWNIWNWAMHLAEMCILWCLLNKEKSIALEEVLAASLGLGISYKCH
jgi:hypothetical protein